jgi:heme-degrading monooxygenase HmoA
MMLVLFELTPRPDQSARYFGLAAQLAEELVHVPGFVSVERFQSLSQPDKFLSLSCFHDEQAVRAWREHMQHRRAQLLGRAEIFADYRLRVVQVVRDYGLAERGEAPPDSRPIHGG